VITVFYDGKCGLCRREIDHYRRVAPEAVFLWVDITINAADLEKLGVSYADGLKQLHARDSEGKIHTGVDAFILLWQQMPRWRLLARIIALPIIRTVANKAYNRFAAWRVERLNHCQLAVQIKENKDAR
jgi:predicted DCC family thiol-disulfide oxidoreductase YuxK